MKSLIQEIEEILNPNNGISLIQEGRLYQLQPLLPLFQIIEMEQQLDETGQSKIVEFLKAEGIVIVNNIVYLKTKGLNFKGRLQEILTIYNQHIKQVIGNKKALIDLYDKLSPEDIANLTEDHVIFVMKDLLNGSGRGLMAARYLPDYDIYFEKMHFQMPGCMISAYIDENLAIGNVEVISEGNQYEHPFVFRNTGIFGQEICMGTFKDSKEKVQFNRLRFANNLNSLFKQAIQILVAGYNRGVTPANGHLTDAKYQKFMIKEK
jgi:hypothetical protein